MTTPIVSSFPKVSNVLRKDNDFLFCETSYHGTTTAMQQRVVVPTKVVPGAENPLLSCYYI
jgi:hypothetical protein